MKYFVAPGEDRRLDRSVRESLRGSFIQLADGVTHYELTGPSDGDVVVLMGGLTVPLFYWDDTAAALHDRGLRTLAYSAYGRGYSDRVHANYDERLFVGQLAELVDALDLPPRRHLVGASMGALVAMSYLTEQPAAATTLTLLGPAGLSPAPDTQKLLADENIANEIATTFGQQVFDQHQSHNVRDQQRAAALDTMIRDAYRYEGSLFAFFDTLQHFGLFDRAELYGRTGTLAVPTMLMWGDDDEVTPISSLAEVSILLQPDQCHVVEKCGHMVPFERPELVANALADFTSAPTDR